MTRLRSQAVSEAYLDLVRRFPLRPLRDDAEHRRALEVMDGLVGFDGLAPGQKDYMEALTFFVEQYEREHHAIDTAGLSAPDMLRFLARESGMSASEFGRRVLGRRELGVKVLNGSRCLSKSQILAVSEYFRVDARLFLGPARARGRKPAAKWRTIKGPQAVVG
jgi:HTH-type transcriptional regulator/antitoxin HigA